MLAVLALPLLLLAGLMLMQRLEEVLLPAAPAQPPAPAPEIAEIRIRPVLAVPDDLPPSAEPATPAAGPMAPAAEAPGTRGRAGATPSCPHRRHPHQRRHPAKAA
ncbi:hypothetical protein GCM10009733_082220 [Nonomuraea maheshkhaliensis]|uniref:Energy transducer TonB n=1 Tax=Nonomuraea maheshkhaliensis TaxID=419590 RepID=A0ABN2GK43_9ACTN